MIYLHLIAAILATWRLTELMTQDRITQPIRAKLKTYLWSCSRCMSVWCGAWSTLMFALGPATHDLSRWSLWPFAFAWLYLVHLESVVAKRVAEKGRRLTIDLRQDGTFAVNSDLNQQESLWVLNRVIQQFIPQQQPPSTANGEAKSGRSASEVQV